ncbi:hypothetical protein PtA15_8A735 [Puccinia triticina]|uniref:RING-type domain-containing protein n=1 Tax=Puccinia triticina TaxID=208348 RepID=A0ABY7CSB5_9BASI|nr:uncharacterized protein PtA15_8A735 [Puccinia triticina]WAQ87828.1 hypothetical protein PtA15_8A735 [Puccinia triticina]WAR57705.1 hypothetical protein PtB15_8B758 [Puccinia triticina]
MEGFSCFGSDECTCLERCTHDQSKPLRPQSCQFLKLSSLTNMTDSAHVDPKCEQPDPAPNSTKQKRFEIKKCNAVAQWRWDILVDNCAICKILIMEPCNECEANQTGTTNEACSAAWGTCNHAYHLHCISKWTKTSSVCPLCGGEWEIEKIGQ